MPGSGYHKKQGMVAGRRCLLVTDADTTGNRPESEGCVRIEGRKAGTPGQMLRCGMVGGGPGSFIGGVHRAALGLDNSAQLVAGCFSRDGDKNRQTGEALRIVEDRVYPDFTTMARMEGRRDDPIDFPIVTSPNSSP